MNLEEIMNSPATMQKYVEVDYNPLSKVKKIRIYYKPNIAMREVHSFLKEVILSHIRENVIMFPSNSGWFKGSSPTKNILRHKREGVFPRHWFVTDIKNAFPSVDKRALTIILRPLFPKVNGELLQKFVEKFCVDENGKLAQGLPASPYLFNLFAEQFLDAEIRQLISGTPIKYSRLGDDLIFSSTQLITRKKRQEIYAILQKASMPVHFRKTHIFDLEKQKTIQLNGIGVTNRNGRSELFLPGHYKRKLKGMLSGILNKRIKMHFQVLAGYMSPFLSLHKNNLSSKLDHEIILLYRKVQIMENGDLPF